MPFRRKNCDDVLSRHGFTPAMSFYEKYPDCVSDTKKHPTAKAVGCFFGGPSVPQSENPLRRSEAKRADCHDCTAPVREPTDARRNECAVGTLKKFANLSPHIFLGKCLLLLEKSIHTPPFASVRMLFVYSLSAPGNWCGVFMLFRYNILLTV